MDLRSILRICFAVLSICGYSIVFIGHKKLEKAIRELDTEKEIAVYKKEMEEIITKEYRLIYAGIIPASIFAIIAIFLNE